VFASSAHRPDCKKLYIEPLRQVRADWRVVEIADANHITCILRPQFRTDIAEWLAKNTKQ
jgi:hypothetical protein